MSIMASLSLLVGIVLGLRFNVRLLFLACLVAIVVGVAVTLFGRAGIAEVSLHVVMVTVALQVGYFVSMVVGALNLTEAPETSKAGIGEASRRRFEVPRT